MTSTVTIQLNAAAAARRPHPKLTLVDDTGATVILPFAPVEATLSGLGPRFEQVDVAGGRPPLLVNAAPQLAKLTFEATITDTRNPFRSVENFLGGMTIFARRARRVSIRNYGPAAGGPWRITGFDAAIFAREAGTNHAAGYTASLELTAASDAASHVSPLTGGAKTATSKVRTVEVLAGETAELVAFRTLGSTSAANVLLGANGIRDPRTLAAGQVLTVPDLAAY